MTDKQQVYFKEMRSKWFDIVSYLDKEDISYWCEVLPVIAYAYIFHDKDKCNEDIIEDNVIVHCRGQPKKPHWHIILCFEHPRRALNLCRKFNSTEIRPIPSSAKLLGSYKYLLHECEDNTRLDKYLYDNKERTVKNEDFFDSLSPSANCTAMDIIDALLNEVPLRQMISMFGKDFIYHYKQYSEMASLIIKQDNIHSKLIELNQNE